MLNRRGLLTGLGAALAAPAIIRTPGLLMPIRPTLALPALIVAAFRADKGESCPIVAATLLHDVSSPEYPREWIRAEAGPVCTAWVPMPDPGAGRLEDARQVEMAL